MSNMNKMKIRTYVINAFVDTSKSSALDSGNPAAVTLLTTEQEEKLTDEQRQAIAKEMNLSETAYVSKRNEENNYFNLRWFTPKYEVDLCGHATLAAAAAVVTEEWATIDSEIIFETRKHGKLYVTVSGKDEEMEYSMRFPALLEKKVVGEEERFLLISGLSITEDDVIDVYQSDYDHIVYVKDSNCVTKCVADYQVLERVETRCIIITAEYKGNENKFRFSSRSFAPRYGILEDPATGSAHCVLAPLYLKQGEIDVKAVQLSERGGHLTVGRPNTQVVQIAGATKIFWMGQIIV